MTITGTADAGPPDAVLQMALTAELPAREFGAHIGQLALPAHRVPPTLTVHALDALFRADSALRFVVMDGEDAPALVSRSWFDVAMTGRLGYGRLVHQRRRLREVLPGGTLVFPADRPVAEVAAAVIRRRTGSSDLLDGVVVTTEDGALGVAPVTAVFEQLAQQYAYQALHDPLTGLPNRLFLLERLRQVTADGSSAVLCYVDLDRFKDVNDGLGHAAGDQVLVDFAQRLRAAARADDLVVRLSGDEFAVLTETPLSLQQRSALADRIVLSAASPFVVETGSGQQLVALGASVGVAATGVPDDAEPTTDATGGAAPDALLLHGDLALYRAKSLGRGRVAHFGHELLVDAETDAVRARHHMERRLRQAIEHEQLDVHYQPITGLPSGQVTGVEALARWEDAELGRVSPDQFIPLAERSGLVVDLGRWVLRTACREAAGWPVGRSGVPPTVSVNVSPVQLAERAFVDDVRTVLADTGLAPERLCLEITETAAITDLPATAARLGELRELGVRLALDDFGSGHSALSLLRGLPVDLVKIDRSFIERVASETADAVLVRLVVEAAHSLGRRVLAEGVETPEQAQQLVAMGCDAAQGWLFGRPEPASPRLTRLLTDRAQAEPLSMGDGVPALPLGGNDELVLVTTPDRVITYASASSGPILGWLPQELVGTSVGSYLHPDDLPRLRSERHEGALVHRVVHRDGGVRWLESTTRSLRDDDGDVREVLTVSRDVTATVQARRALADSEAMFRHAFDDAPIGMTLTRMDGRLLRVNKAFAALLGATTEELQDRRVQELTSAVGRADQREALDGLFTRFIGVTELSTHFLHADGHEVPVLVRVSVVRDRAGAPTSVFAHVVPESTAPQLPVEARAARRA